MRTLIALALMLALALPAVARTEKVMTYEENANGDRHAELQIKSDEVSILAGCRASSKSEDVKYYWMKSDHQGNKVCVENSKQDDVTRRQYLQKCADGKLEGAHAAY